MKTRKIVLGFAVLMLVDVLAQVAFKYAAIDALPLALTVQWGLRVFSQPWIYVALAGYLATFFLWMSLLRDAPVGPAFAASHLEIVAVMVVSVYLFDESLTLPKLAGGAAILAGIVVLAFGERAAARAGRQASAPAAACRPGP